MSAETFSIIWKVALALIAVGAAWADIRHQLSSMRDDMDHNSSVLQKWLLSLTTNLGNNKAITKNEASVLAGTLHLKIKASGNPISQEEANLLKSYVEKAKKGQLFTPEEANSFNELSKKYANDPEIRKKENVDQLASLVVLAGIIFGLYALSKASSK